MSLQRLQTRVAKLEAQRPPVQEPYIPPEPPPGWYEEVIELLQQYGYLTEVLRLWGIPEHEIAAMEEAGDVFTS